MRADQQSMPGARPHDAGVGVGVGECAQHAERPVQHGGTTRCQKRRPQFIEALQICCARFAMRVEAGDQRACGRIIRAEIGLPGHPGQVTVLVVQVGFVAQNFADNRSGQRADILGRANGQHSSAQAGCGRAFMVRRNDAARGAG